MSMTLLSTLSNFFVFLSGLILAPDVLPEKWFSTFKSNAQSILTKSETKVKSIISQAPVKRPIQLSILILLLCLAFLIIYLTIFGFSTLAGLQGFDVFSTDSVGPILFVIVSVFEYGEPVIWTTFAAAIFFSFVGHFNEKAEFLGIALWSIIILFGASYLILLFVSAVIRWLAVILWPFSGSIAVFLEALFLAWLIHVAVEESGWSPPVIVVNWARWFSTIALKAVVLFANSSATLEKMSVLKIRSIVGLCFLAVGITFDFAAMWM